MNEKFTPGPIQKEFNNDAKWLLTDEDGYPIADVYGGDMITDEANANLFAAAPDMYEALDNLLEAWDEWGVSLFPDPFADMARAALAKARGEESTS